MLSHKGLEHLCTGMLKFKVKKKKKPKQPLPSNSFKSVLMIILYPDSWFSKWLEMELMGLQLFVVNFSINNIFLSALDLMKCSEKSPVLFQSLRMLHLSQQT